MPDIELSTGTLHYRDSGDGPPIVFVHGIFVNGTLWQRLIAILEAQFRCTAPDLPLGAHSRAMRPDANLSPHGVAALIAEFLDALDLSDVTLVANDTGGAISQLLISTNDERIARVVLMPCDSFHNFLPASIRILQYAPRVPGLLWLGAQLMRPRLVQRLAYGTLAKRPIPAETTRGWMHPFIAERSIRRDIGKFLCAIDNRDTMRAAERLRGFTKPVLLLWPRRAPFFPFRYAERWACLLPNAQLIEVPDSYTYLPTDQPEFTAAAIAAFINQHAGADNR